MDRMRAALSPKKIGLAIASAWRRFFFSSNPQTPHRRSREKQSDAYAAHSFTWEEIIEMFGEPDDTSDGEGEWVPIEGTNLSWKQISVEW